jgi:DNA-binding transcriptional ArsR family regulator
VSWSPLERVVMHDGRLNVLCCLLDGTHLSVRQLAARTGAPPRAVSYWITLLHSVDLVERQAVLEDGEPLYEATLDDHPEWVREAVCRHRSEPG